MNKNKYLAKRLLIFLKGAIPAFVFLFIPKVGKRIIFSSDLNCSYKNNSKFLFEYFLDKHPEKEIRYVVNCSKLRKDLSDRFGNYFIETDSLAGVFYALRAKTWVVSSLETPVGGVFLGIGRYVHHLGHGAPLKRIGLLEKYSNPLKKIYLKLIRFNFSYFFSTSELFRSAWSNCVGVNPNKVFIIGQARTDQLCHPDETLARTHMTKTPSNSNILYAPTWRPFSKTKLFPFHDLDLARLSNFLEANDCNIFLRLHPNFEDMVPEEFSNSSRIKTLANSEITDINDILGSFDLLITDYSSIYIDYLVTGNPILFLPYDYHEYDAYVGFNICYSEYAPGPMPKNQIEFELELNRLLCDRLYYSTERAHVNGVLNPSCRNNCQENADFILKQLK
jgi:CDP-glycerol glycerophosphotransferase (TagB/SpsB family)